MVHPHLYLVRNIYDARRQHETNQHEHALKVISAILWRQCFSSSRFRIRRETVASTASMVSVSQLMLMRTQFWARFLGQKQRKEKLVLSMGTNTENSTEANSLCVEEGARSCNVQYTASSSLLLERCYRSCWSSRSTIRTAWRSDIIQRQFMALCTARHAEGRWWLSRY